MYQTYIKKMLLFLVLFALPICGNWLFLLNSGELLPIKEIVNRQLQTGENYLVGLATRNQGYYYKREMYFQHKPTVFVHGSSRVMQFKKDYFSHSMFNSGGTMSSVNEGYSFIKEVFAKHKPEIMIMGIDYWWFNKNVIAPTTTIKPPLELSHRISFRSYLLPYKWLWQGKINFAEYFQQMDPLNLLRNTYPRGIGVDAIVNRSGFAPDGSYVYTKYVIGKEPSIDPHFSHNLALIKMNDPHFEQGAVVDETHFKNFMDMLAYLQEQNVKVILFIPPIAPTVTGHLQNFTLIEDLRKKLNKAGILYYDFHDPKFLSINDCEFLDGTHGGEVLYARILEWMADHEPQLKHHLRNEYVHAVGKYYRNLAMIPNEITSSPEIDFLGIGCGKENQYASIPIIAL